MPDEPTNAQIALLCDIGDHHLSTLTGEKRRDMDWLISEGYVEPTGDNPSAALKLTAKGNQFLGERGAGLNEA